MGVHPLLKERQCKKRWQSTSTAQLFTAR